MPTADPPLSQYVPLSLGAVEAEFISSTVRRFFGADAITRNFSSHPERLDVHVETDRDVGMIKYDCLGVLLTRIDKPIDLEVTKRGAPIRGNAKLAYRSGIVL